MLNASQYNIAFFQKQYFLLHISYSSSAILNDILIPRALSLALLILH